MSNDLLLNSATDALKMANLERQKKQVEQIQKADPHQQAEMEKAAKDFEALLVQQMMKSMWQTVDSKGSLLGSREEEYYRDMLNQAVAEHISEHQSIGVKDVIMRDLKKYQGG